MPSSCRTGLCSVLWLLISFLGLVPLGQTLAWEEPRIERDFLLNRMMIARLREYRGDPAGKALLESLRNEANRKGISIPEWSRSKIHVPRQESETGFRNELCSNKYDHIIQEVSSVYRLPPALIKAVIRAESAFLSDAVSHKGAQGLMQLMPETAEAIGVQNPFNPMANILGGARLLRKYLDEFRSVKKTLIAYNAGPGWVDAGKPLPGETREYIRKVIAFYHDYTKKR